MGTLDKGVTLDKLGKEGVLPSPIVKNIMSKAYGDSVVGRLAGTTPIPASGMSITVPVGEPVAGIVGEGELKPIITAGVATKTLKTKKVAALMYWSEEARRKNPVGYLGYLEKTAADAIRRAIDMAVLHGKNALTGAALEGVEYVAQTGNSIDLGTTDAAGGGLTGDILAAYDLVLQDGGDISAFVADPLMRTKLMRATTKDGLPVYNAYGDRSRGGIDLTDPMGDLLGVPVAYSKAVSGKMGAVEDTKIRMIGGDFKNSITFGYTMSMNYRRSTEAVIVDGGNPIYLWQQNLEAFIIEAEFGWVLRNKDDFVTLKEKVG